MKITFNAQSVPNNIITKVEQESSTNDSMLYYVIYSTVSNYDITNGPSAGWDENDVIILCSGNNIFSIFKNNTQNIYVNDNWQDITPIELKKKCVGFIQLTLHNGNDLIQSSQAVAYLNSELSDILKIETYREYETHISKRTWQEAMALAYDNAPRVNALEQRASKLEENLAKDNDVFGRIEKMTLDNWEDT